MFDTKGKYYLGRVYDPKTTKTTADPLLYDSEDLTTHGVIVGMTGSGKTGLCIGLIEEAILGGVPSIMIDPKGDITNLALHFPEFLPSDFEPWINPDEAKRSGKSTAEIAAETAAMWKNGLADWDIEPARVAELKEKSHLTIYTPGSTAGVPVSVLSSMGAPGIPWAGNEEVLGERISGTVAALLGLVGYKDVDPVQSREHILMSNIFQNAWSQGRDLTLGDLIMQIQAPPFTQLGVLSVDALFPEKDRSALAMRINNMLASPSFQPWIQGEPLDIQRMLTSDDGSPRHSIFYIAHLTDELRMFFVTLLYGAIETWMRSQSGTSSLRAIVYFDEIFGYVPPIGNPPSKEPMLRMLKQARAFGVSMLLATQNPVDLDYKGLSNAGTWFIGRLATEQDKKRLIDGLASADQSGLDQKEYDRLISAIGKRVFLMRNVHDKNPTLFQTRWAMNYLAGPMTRAQLPALNALAGGPAAPAAAAAAPAAAAEAEATTAATAAPVAAAAGLSAMASTTRPAVPSTLKEFFLPRNLSPARAAAARDLTASGTPSLVYRPGLLAQADIRSVQTRYKVDLRQTRTALVTSLDERGGINWDEAAVESFDIGTLETQPEGDARFAALPAAVAQDKAAKALEGQFATWVYNTASLTLRANEKLKVYAGPDVSDDAFRDMCKAEAEKLMAADLEKAEVAVKKKIAAVQAKLEKEEQELVKDKTKYEQRRQEEYGRHAENLLGLFTKKRTNLSSSLSKRRMAEEAKAEVEESELAIAKYQAELEALNGELQTAQDDARRRWDDVVNDVTEIPLTPKKSDITVTQFAIAWVPFYELTVDGRAVEVPAYQG